MTQTPVPAAGAPGWREKKIQVLDGSLIYYRWCGRGSPVLLCDGIGCDGFIWKYLTPTLSRTHRVYHFHYRGHGESPPPSDPQRVSIEVLADDLMQVMDDAALDRAVIAGHSMGVQTCLEAYRRHPHRVSGMVLTCGSHGSPLNTFYGSDLLHYLLPLIRQAAGRSFWPIRMAWRALLSSDLAKRIAASTEVNGALIRPGDMAEYMEQLSRVDPALFLRMLSYADQHQAGDLLEKITCPVLIVVGDNDGFTPVSLSREMSRRIPNATLVTVPGGTHAAPLERSELVTRSIESFVSVLDEARSSSA